MGEIIPFPKRPKAPKPKITLDDVAKAALSLPAEEKAALALVAGLVGFLWFVTRRR